MKSQHFNSNSGPFTPPTKGGAVSNITFFGLIGMFIKNLLSAIPLSMRLFLRRRIGSMTFTLAGLFFAAIWIRFILDGTYQMHELTPPETFVYPQFNKGTGFRYAFALTIWYIGMFFLQFGGVIAKFAPPDVLDGISSVKEIISNFPFFLSIGVITIGLWRFWKIRRMHAKREFFDPMGRGESLFFEPLLNVLKPRNRPLTLMFLEVGSLLSLALIFYWWSFGNPEWMDYSILLTIGAIGLAIEEWISQQQIQKELEYRFANEYKAQELQDTYQQYKQEALSSVATVSFVGFGTRSPVKKKAIQTIVNKTAWHEWKLNWPSFAIKNRNWFYALSGVSILFILISLWVTRGNDQIELVGIVKTQNLAVRKSNSLAASRIGTIPEETIVKIYDCYSPDKNGRSWCKIEYNGRVGYVAKAGASGRQYMWTLPLVMHDLSFYDFPYSDQVLTDGGYLNLRLEPKINAPILNRITKGETVSVLDVASSPTFMTINEKLIFGCWVLVEYQSQQGYCFSWYLEDTRIPSIDPFSELD